MGCVYRHRAIPQGQPRHHAYLARGGGDRVDASAHGGSGLGSTAPLVARRPRARLRLHAGERRAAVGAAGRRRGGEARRVTSLPDGVSDPLWLPDGAALIVTSDIKWPAQQEIDRRNGDLPTDARLWTGLLWRHWDDWRAGKRQHLFAVTLSDGSTRDVTPI